MVVAPTDVVLPDVTLAILAGGAGSRMGMPKAMLTIDGQPILEYLLDHLNWHGPTLLVTAPGREYPPGWQRFSAEVTDPEPNGGPLRGVLTALEHLETPLLLVLTVDMPGIRLPQCAPLLDCMRQKADVVGAMMCRTINGRQQVEPFPCALRAESTAIIARRLAANQRSVNSLLDEKTFVKLAAPEDWDEQVWANLNFASDLGRFR